MKLVYIEFTGKNRNAKLLCPKVNKKIKAELCNNKCPYYIISRLSPKNDYQYVECKYDGEGEPDGR